MSEHDKGMSGWFLVELMGHRRIAAHVSEAQAAGASLLRLDIPNESGTLVQFYSPSALYCMTPITEDTARTFAQANPVEPASPWDFQGRTRQIAAAIEVDDFDEADPGDGCPQ